jgi:uncharacterized membrane protein (UPF0182 family)
MRRLPAFVLAAVLLLFILPSAVEYYTDWLWFQELGYPTLFVNTLNAQTLVFAATGAAVFAFLYLNLRLARTALTRPSIVLGTGVDGRPIALEGRRVAGLALWVSGLIALVLALTASSAWLTWLNFIHAQSFGENDALFGRDISFYVFKLPIYQLIRQQALTTSVLTLMGCGLYYVLSGSFVVESQYGAAFWPRLRLLPRARRHLALLAALIFGLMAWGAWLEIPDILLTPATVVFGASYADVHARIPLLRAEVVTLALGVVLAIWHGFSRLRWPMPIAIGLFLVVSVGGALYAAGVQRFIVTPNELETEQPFIAHGIAATRRAYALDRVDEREVSGDAELTPEAIVSNAATIENVRLWDHQPLRQTFQQIQEIRPYYEFQSIDNDRYRIDGKIRQIMLSVRELNTEEITTRSWNNEHLQYTHGYGLTLGPVNQVTTEGLPVLFIRDLPPVSTKPDLKITEPSIYFGELANAYVLVRTKQPEFHYPRQETNETTVYSGTGGVSVGSLWRRLIFAIRFATTNILVTDQITDESRILFHRQIGERVRRLAPFLTYDRDPYPVISDGRIFWIQDAYTTSANYPYSNRAVLGREELNYIRNSIKIVIDAYNGTTTFYVAEAGDPIVRTLAQVFPGWLRPLADMPAGLRQHVRYPEDIFGIQAAVYATFHMTSPLVFYNNEDPWQVPVLETGQTQAPMQPYYTIMKLPGEREPEFIQMLPFTPKAKDNLSAWLVARSDGEHYGRLLAFRFPKQKIIYGPKQIVGRMSQDEKISPQITLWNQQGSLVIQGTLLVIPIDESLLYVRPIYLKSAQGRIPELKRVIVAYKEKIIMAETLNLALAEIFGPRIVSTLAPDRLEPSATSVIASVVEETRTPEVTTAKPASTVEELVTEALQHLDLAERAARSGDWAAYGEEQKKAKAALEAAARIKK